jgi:hypothetical protein
MIRILATLAILALPIAVWFVVIQPRLGGRVSEIGANLDTGWARFKARVYAFRTFVAGTLGLYVAELPGALQAIGALDGMPSDWRLYVGLATIVVMMLTRAYSTTPVNRSEA